MQKQSRSKGQGKFAQVAKAEIPRSSFDRSHGIKTTFDSAFLIPIFCDEALPGDTFNLRMHTFARLATPIYPILDNLHLDSQFFAVPIRLLWDNFEKFMGRQDDPGDSTSFEIPQLVSTGGAGEYGSLSDHIGIPPNATSITHSALWHRAYNLIYNEWYRDQNLINSVVVDTDDGPDTYADYSLLRRGKRHDYFTSCLPWPQKGDAVLLPLGTSAPVTGTISAATITVDPIGGAPTFDVGDNAVTTLRSQSGVAGVFYDANVGSADDAIWVDPQLDVDIGGTAITGTADLSTATAATINQLRQAFQIQRLYERDARGGTRYTEIIRAHFGVTSPDQRLQRPEYLGGGSQAINFTPVAQTSKDADPEFKGSLSAYATSQGSSHAFTKSFTEHCIIIGLVSVRADLNYQQGLARMFSRLSRFDFFWPALSHIGEQSVLNKEIWAQGTDDLVADAATFGYQERYAEYRYKPSEIHNQFRSDHATPLDAWHLAQDFATLPTLGETFINETPPVSRIVAVPSEPEFLFDAWFDLTCARPMPTYGTPGLIDHL